MQRSSTATRFVILRNPNSPDMTVSKACASQLEVMDFRMRMRALQSCACRFCDWFSIVLRLLINQAFAGTQPAWNFGTVPPTAGRQPVIAFTCFH